MSTVIIAAMLSGRELACREQPSDDVTNEPLA
jgi:hypothetical protein